MDYAIGKLLALLVFMSFVIREFWFVRRAPAGREVQTPNAWYYLAICIVVVMLSQMP